jgi:endonuclease YncB( thermonuclease family)
VHIFVLKIRHKGTNFNNIKKLISTIPSKKTIFVPKMINMKPQLQKLLFLILLVPVFTSTPVLAATITGKVVRVADGDTFTLLTSDNRQERIRLDGIDAPEKGQDFSEKSRQHLASFVAGKNVRVEYKTRDMYGRILGTVFVGKTNINHNMLRNGLAWQYKYNRNKTCAALQHEAQEKKLNIWSLPNPVNPIDYRKSKRKKPV